MQNKPVHRAASAVFSCRMLAGALVCAFGMTGSVLPQSKGATPASPAANAAFNPAPLPNPGIPGFIFPTAPDVIGSWTQKNDQPSIQRHAWGIWTALTQASNVKFEGQDLRIFETWDTPADIGSGAAPSATTTSRRPNVLTPLRQFGRFAQPQANAKQDEATVTGFVKYDPVAAAHIRANQLLSAIALEGLLQSGAASVPDFPPASISLKPVFNTLSSKQLVQGRYFKLAVWPGTPSVPKPFPSAAWGTCVWIDIQEPGAGTGTGQTDKSCKTDGSSRTPGTTYGIGNFIAFRLSAAAITAMAKPQAGVASGDYAVLVAMHVTSREIKPWTWQTFWWTPDANAPPAPSSKAIAALRPAQLTGAARHYAHCAAYQTLSPPQPDTGGQNKGESVYCFNPYLEAGFGPGDLPDSIPGQYAGKTVKNNVGVQTNCMSCHAAANFNPKNIPGAPNYSGDRYVDLKDPRFKGTLSVDFLWSIPGNAK